MKIRITETDPVYIQNFSSFLVQLGAVPISGCLNVFEAPEDFDVGQYHGLSVGGEAPKSFREEHPAVATWLEAYTGDFEFYVSVRDQLARKGMLSPKQTEAIYRAIDRDKASVAAPIVSKTFTLAVGEVIILSKFAAQRVAQAAGCARPHRAFEVLEVKAETAKAYLARVKLSAQRTSHCGICGIALTTPDSVAAGIGPVCAEKNSLPYGGNSLEALAEMLSVTTEATAWIAKSTIKERKL
jgi:hypothetical protein